MSEKVWIEEGDTVRIDLCGDGRAVLTGIVQHIPGATGDSWIIVNEQSVHYVQQFYCMTKARQP